MAAKETRIVAYLRVSTDKQGRSGLGLEAQRAAVAAHPGTTGGCIVAEHVEVESGVEFVAADMPTVNRLTVHILAAVAEEARGISARTKAALAAAKARGVRLGNPQLLARDPAMAARANAVQMDNARRRATAVQPYLDAARRTGTTTLAGMADALMARGVPAPRDRNLWVPAQVRRILKTSQSS